MSDQSNIKICVVGAGIVGLSTATIMQETLPSGQITLIADKFCTETTSDGAAGFFRPSPSFRGPTPEITLKWLKNSFLFYEKILKSNPEEAYKIGIIRRRYVGVSDNHEFLFNPYLKEILPDYRALSPFEIRDATEGKSYKFGYGCDTLLTECRKYQPYLTKKFEDRGGKIVNRKLKSFEELSDDFDLIFNCSGLGARQLCGDTRMTPIRGQVYKVKAPWLNTCLYVESDTYIIPGTDGLVTLGGTRQYESTNLDVDRHDAAGIWERCTKALPSLKNAEILREWVGLRPHLPEVRVEAETLKCKDRRTIQVIHNYGHGGYGVMSAPGTSMHAVGLAMGYLRGRKSKL